jgi:23S rRNA (cytosine1962-C5)-methyltransferase
LGSQLIMLHAGLSLRADFLDGQKTGFFLDQQWNALLLRDLLKNKIIKGSSLKVLDICCYVGQWSAHVADLACKQDVKVEAHLADASEKALALAEKNVSALGAKAVVHKVDVLEGLPEGEFDVVICDPPAFVKKKTDIEPGGRAYEKLLRESIKRCKNGGTLVASSCSGLVDQDLWQSILVSAMVKSGRSVRWALEGGHGPDHPLRSEFREGRYLKCNFGTVEYR